MRIALVIGVVMVIVGCKYEKRDLMSGSGSAGSSSATGSTPPDDGWIVDQIPGDDFVQVLAIAGSSATDVWAVGQNLLAHYDGKTWTDAAPPAFKCARCTLDAISVAAPDDVWAVGNEGRVAHFDGKVWTITQPDLPLTDSERGVITELSRVVAWHGRGVIVSLKSSTTLLGFDGTSWTKLPPPPYSIDDFWGVAPDDLWVWDSISSDRWQAAMRHFDGTRWNAEDLLGNTSKDNWVERIDGSGPSDIWALGGPRGRTSFAGGYHFDGKTWTKVEFPSHAPGVRALDVVGPNEAYAVGGSSVLAWDGTAWKASPGPSALTGQLDNVYAPGGGHLFVSEWLGRRVAHRK